MTCSINKLKSHLLFKYKNFMFSNFMWKKHIFLQEMVGPGGGGGAPLPPFLYGPDKDFYLLDASIEGKIWSVWKKGRGPDPINC